MRLFSKSKAQAAAPPIRALLFDVFGTTVDWLGSLTAFGRQLGAERRIDADWPGLVKEWRAHYKPAIKPVREGKRPWANFDTLHREELDKIAGKFGAAGLSGADRDVFTRAWHHLAPWPDVASGLHRLSKRYIVGPLSNGTLRQMVDLARRGGLPWSVLFGADMFRTYKPAAEIYKGAVAYLELRPEQVMMVAAHNEDLENAAKNGLQTCFVRRATEDSLRGSFTYVVDDFEHLARTLGVV